MNSIRFEELYAESSRNGIYKTKEFHGSGNKIINMGELFAYDFISNQKMKRLELSKSEKNKYSLEDRDLVFGRRSVVAAGAGKCSLIVNPNELIVFESSIIRVRLNKKIANPKFYFYYFKSPQGRGTILSIATGVNIMGIRSSELQKLIIPFPEILIQNKVASTLSAYDNLIENNTRRIQILEEMAQRIYKEWFVDFKYPGHENDELVDSELGMIPDGWLRSFEDVVDFKEGPGLRKWQYRDEGIPFLNIRTLIKNDIDLRKVQYLDPKEVESKYQHFLLEENDHVVSSSGTLGRIATIRGDHLPLMLNTSIIRMRPKANNIGVWQLKHFMMSKYFQHQIKAFAIGSAQPNYGPSHLKQMSIIAPTEVISEKYENKVSSLEIQINLLVKKNNILSKTRDYLLPKLISGKIDVSDLDIDTSILHD